MLVNAIYQRNIKKIKIILFLIWCAFRDVIERCESIKSWSIILFSIKTLIWYYCIRKYRIPFGIHNVFLWVYLSPFLLIFFIHYFDFFTDPSLENNSNFGSLNLNLWSKIFSAWSGWLSGEGTGEWDKNTKKNQKIIFF